VSPENEEFYTSKTYGELRVPQTLLTTAREHHAALAEVVDPDRMVQVVGAGRPTPSGVKDFARIGSLDGYVYSVHGDGTVAHKLSRLTDRCDARLPTYYVEDGHGGLPVNDRVLAALPQLLDTGATTMQRTGAGGTPGSSRSSEWAIPAGSASQSSRSRPESFAGRSGEWGSGTWSPS
jgi:hypothetical protein